MKYKVKITGSVGQCTRVIELETEDKDFVKELLESQTPKITIENDSSSEDNLKIGELVKQLNKRNPERPLYPMWSPTPQKYYDFNSYPWWECNKVICKV